MTVYLVVFCQKYRIYTVYKWFWPTLFVYFLDLVSMIAQAMLHAM